MVSNKPTLELERIVGFFLLAMIANNVVTTKFSVSVCLEV